WPRSPVLVTMLLRGLDGTAGEQLLGPRLEDLAVGAEGQRRERGGVEPADLLDLVLRWRLASRPRRPVRQDDDALGAQHHVLNRQQRPRFHLHAALLLALAGHRLLGMLVPLDVATRQPPQPATGFDVALDQQDPALFLDQGDHHQLRVAEEDGVAVRANRELAVGDQAEFHFVTAAWAVFGQRSRILQPAGTIRAARTSLTESPIRHGERPSARTWPQPT